MTERTRDWWQAWTSPSVIITLAGFLVMIGVSRNQLTQIQVQLDDTQAQVARLQESGIKTAATVSDQLGQYRVDLAHYQEKVAALSQRLELVEKFSVDQNQINTGLFSRISKMER